MTRSLVDKAICAARAAWYQAYESRRLRRERRRHWHMYLHATVYAPLPLASFLRPFVTVYIPTHNRADLLLTRSLPSVIKQTYKNLEIIVAAHGCTDDTVRRVRWLMPTAHIYGPPEDQRIRLLQVARTRTYPPTAENHWLAGPVVPANAALVAAKGDWIMRLDDDDRLMPDAVEKLLRFAQQGDFEFVSAAYQTPNGTVWDDGEVPPAGGVQTWLYRSYLKFMHFNGSSWRKAHCRVNDTDLVDRFRKAGVRMGYLSQVVCYIEPRPGETEIGSKAYRRDKEGKEKHFAFRN